LFMLDVREDQTAHVAIIVGRDALATLVFTCGRAGRELPPRGSIRFRYRERGRIRDEEGWLVTDFTLKHQTEKGRPKWKVMLVRIGGGYVDALMHMKAIALRLLDASRARIAERP
jgi:hypothetical protein